METKTDIRETLSHGGGREGLVVGPSHFPAAEAPAADGVDYYSLPQVSNSDLSWIEKYFAGQSLEFPEGAARTGHLLDAMLTEPHKLNVYQRKIQGLPYTYTDEEIGHANRMARAFFKDELCRTIHQHSAGQSVIIKERWFSMGQLEFSLWCRCKYDFLARSIGMGADLKTTACTTEAQFREAAIHFDYDRQGAWYMDLSGLDRHLIIGVSKENFKLFLIPMKRDDDMYKSGREKYEDLAFKWWTLFG